MYYVYLLENPATSLPFYVGVAKANRLGGYGPRELQHLSDAKKLKEGKKLQKPNLHKLNTINQILDQTMEVMITIHSRYETENEAFSKEIELISFYGRKDLGTGILTNMTAGGEGCINQSVETRDKRIATMTGRPSPLKGRKIGQYTEDRKKKISDARRAGFETGKIVAWNKGKSGVQVAWNKGVTLTDDQKKNMGAPKGRVPWNKGVTLTDDQKKNIKGFKKGNIPANKGIPSGKKGMSYEEIYGPEVAAKMREVRSKKFL